MATIVAEKYKGITSDPTQAEVLYLVTGTGGDAGTISDLDAFEAVVGSAPSTWNGVPGVNIQVREELVVGTTWLVAALYNSDPGQQVTFQQSSVDYEFSFQAPAAHVYQSLETIAAYSANGKIFTSGEAEANNPFHGAIGVSIKNGEQTVDGVDLPSGAATNTWVFKPLGATITDAYQVGVESVMGNVNSFQFKGRAAGTMRFVSCDGGALFSLGTNPKWQIRFGFQFSRNRPSFTAGGITVADGANGHHYVWSFYNDAYYTASAPEDSGPVKKPVYVIVDRVFEESNFSVLGIGT